MSCASRFSLRSWVVENFKWKHDKCELMIQDVMPPGHVGSCTLPTCLDAPTAASCMRECQNKPAPGFISLEMSGEPSFLKLKSHADPMQHTSLGCCVFRKHHISRCRLLSNTRRTSYPRAVCQSLVVVVGRWPFEVRTKPVYSFCTGSRG